MPYLSTYEADERRRLRRQQRIRIVRDFLLAAAVLIALYFIFLTISTWGL